MKTDVVVSIVLTFLCIYILRKSARVCECTVDNWHGGMLVELRIFCVKFVIKSYCVSPSLSSLYLSSSRQHGH